jgi:hypothetical protein
MKSLKLLMLFAILLFVTQPVAFSQSNVTETFKEHFSETVQQVKAANVADDKREILNTSFDKMIRATERIESLGNLSSQDLEKMASLRSDISEKLDELNGLNGFDEILDEDLDDFSNYSQQAMEQALDRTISIGLGTAILVVLILLLL